MSSYMEDLTRIKRTAVVVLAGLVLVNIILLYLFIGKYGNSKMNALKGEIEAIKYELQVTQEKNEKLAIQYAALTGISVPDVLDGKYVEVVIDATGYLDNNENKDKDLDKPRENVEISEDEMKRIEYAIKDENLSPAEDTLDREEYNNIVAKIKEMNKEATWVDNKFIDTIFKETLKYDIDPYVILAIFQVESRFDKNARNKTSNARGLGQMVKSTGQYLHTHIMKKSGKYNHNDLYDPYKALEYTIAYMNYLKRYKNYDRGLKEYCGGFVKGKETFYENTHRPKLVKAMREFGLTAEDADFILKIRRD